MGPVDALHENGLLWPVLNGPPREAPLAGQLSNRLRGKPDYRMMLASVPVLSSGWSGTGTVVVVPSATFCMTM
jgi:hypothetical protein